MKTRIPLFLLFVLILTVFSCKKYPPIKNENLDSKAFVDSSLIFPERYLISASDSFKDISKPVLIAAHGYTATPFEWEEFKNFLDKQSDTVYISRVLLGGHGRSYDDFNSTTWKDWQKPIIDEYNKLYNLGFRNISMAGSSTGCPLILDLIATDFFSTKVAPENIFFIDPIIQPSNKALNYVGILGYFIPYIEVEVTEMEMPYWYKYRGRNSLVQLNETLKTNRKHLKKGISLPQNIQHFQVFKVKVDDSAAPESAKWLYDAIKMADGSAIDTFMINSNLHVFTRLKGRDTFSEEDVNRQQETFNLMYQKIVN